MRIAQLFYLVAIIPLAIAPSIYKVVDSVEKSCEISLEIYEILLECETLFTQHPFLDYYLPQAWGRFEVNKFNKLLGHLNDLVVEATKHPEFISLLNAPMPKSWECPSLLLVGRVTMYLLGMRLDDHGTLRHLTLENITLAAEEAGIAFIIAKGHFLALQLTLMSILLLNTQLTASSEAERQWLEGRHQITRHSMAIAGLIDGLHPLAEVKTFDAIEFLSEGQLSYLLEYLEDALQVLKLSRVTIRSAARLMMEGSFANLRGRGTSIDFRWSLRFSPSNTLAATVREWAPRVGLTPRLEAIGDRIDRFHAHLLLERLESSFALIKLYIVECAKTSKRLRMGTARRAFKSSVVNKQLRAFCQLDFGCLILLENAINEAASYQAFTDDDRSQHLFSVIKSVLTEASQLVFLITKKLMKYFETHSPTRSLDKKISKRLARCNQKVIEVLQRLQSIMECVVQKFAGLAFEKFVLTFFYSCPVCDFLLRAKLFADAVESKVGDDRFDFDSFSPHPDLE